MQVRDLYQHDYTMTYYPKINIETFSSDMYTLKRGRLDTVLYDEEDLKEDTEIYDWERKTQLASLVTGLGTILLYNKIPLINRCQAKWKKFFFMTFLFFLPSTISGGFSVARQQAAINKVYQKHFDKYVKFKQVGDLKVLNPKVQLQD